MNLKLTLRLGLGSAHAAGNAVAPPLLLPKRSCTPCTPCLCCAGLQTESLIPPSGSGVATPALAVQGYKW